MKKINLSFKGMLKSMISESDILNKNQELKFAVIQELPGYVQTFMSQIKTDKYQEASMTLDAIIDTCKKIQQEMSRVMSSGPR